uniref:SOCS box domain-containing protein n=1 Tax=Sphaeramia orbicularis TaxID=375764 RepID=A0A673AGU7_9TELE
MSYCTLPWSKALPTRPVQLQHYHHFQHYLHLKLSPELYRDTITLPLNHSFQLQILLKDRALSTPPPACHSSCTKAGPGEETSQNLSPLQTVIRNDDVPALMGLIRQKCSSLTDPNANGWIALHEAAHCGRLQCLRLLVRAYPDLVNKCSVKNETPLLLAVARGDATCVEFLLNHRADPNVANTDRDTPLYAACEHSNEAMVDVLLRFGAQVNRPCCQGGTALHEICMRGDLKICKMLLEAGANLQARNNYGIQPLFTAAQHGHGQLINLLAKNGADINGQANDGASPLFEASKNGYVSAVEVLLSLKADANRSTKSGLLPLHVAVQNNHSRIVSMLIPITSRVRVRRSGISPLHIAAEKDHDDMLEMLIHAGFDVNAELSEERSRMYEDRRSTPLYCSVYNGNLEATEMLLEAGANPNLDVFNPLLIAVRLGWVDIATLLLTYGANVNAQISTKPSPFPSAILFGIESLPMLKLLMDHGCDARPCFDCCYGNKIHPPPPPERRPVEELQFSRESLPERSIQFCETVCTPGLHHVTGPIVSILLDYVGHVQLCSRLREALELRADWDDIKLKAYPPHPLMQLCRLKIRQLLGFQRLKLLPMLPLPVRLIRFLQYDVQCLLN